MKYENHCASRTIVNYAKEHRTDIALEDLGGIKKSKKGIKRYAEKNNWAYAQLDTFICYKAALLGVPIIYVNPAYTSQRCSRCGNIHKVNGKQYSCPICKHTDHRDVNAAFNIARLGLLSLDPSSDNLSVLSLRSIGGPYAGKELMSCVS